MGNLSFISRDQLLILSQVMTEPDRWWQAQKAKPCSGAQALSGLKQPHKQLSFGRLGEVWQGLPCPAHLGALGQLQTAFEAGPAGECRAPTRRCLKGLYRHREDSAQSSQQSALLCFTALILYLVLLAWDCPWDCISTHWRHLRVLAQSASQWEPSMFLEEKWNHLTKTWVLLRPQCWAGWEVACESEWQAYSVIVFRFVCKDSLSSFLT